MTRLQKIKKLIAPDSAFLVSNVPDIIYLTGFSYFSKEEREAYLFITRDGQYIITDGRYAHAVRTQVKDFVFLESGEKSPVEIIEEIVKKEKIRSVGIQPHDLTVFEHQKLEKIFGESKHFDLSDLRRIKEGKEIERIRRACELGDRAFEYILGIIKEGITEKEVQLELDVFMRKNNGEPSFPTIVAFEENAAIPHHKTGLRKLKDNEFVLLDFGVKLDEYCSDMTRTVHFGKASEEKKKVYKTVLNSQKKAVEILDSELLIKDKQVEASLIDKVSRDYISLNGFPSIPHSLGHGIGLEVHEAPHLSHRSKDMLENGMVFSIEPGIYLNDKFGVRIEDLFAIEGNQLVQLTASPKNLIEL